MNSIISVVVKDVFKYDKRQAYRFKKLSDSNIAIPRDVHRNIPLSIGRLKKTMEDDFHRS